MFNETWKSLAAQERQSFSMADITATAFEALTHSEAVWGQAHPGVAAVMAHLNCKWQEQDDDRGMDLSEEKPKNPSF